MPALARLALRVTGTGALASAVAVGGCSGALLDVFGGDASLEIHSDQTGGTLAPALQTAVYSAADANTADVYLSDLPLRDLTAEGTEPLDGAAGVIVHVHYFLTPRAGRTPIDYRASNASVRVYVLAPAPPDPVDDLDAVPRIGVYGGGGFVLPRRAPGRAEFSGTMRQGTVRLTEQGPGFSDRLVTAGVSGRVRATKNDAAARALAETIAALLDERGAQPVALLEPAKPPARPAPEPGPAEPPSSTPAPAQPAG